MTSQPDEGTLDNLIKKSQTEDLDSFSQVDVSNFAQAFALPSGSVIRSKAYVLLSALCQKARELKGTLADEMGTKKLANLFGPYIVDTLTETDDALLRAGICTLHALFQVDWLTAEAVITVEGVVANIMEGLDLSHSAQLEEDVAHLLGQASSHKLCREIIPVEAVRWLGAKSRQSSNLSMQAAAAVALIKYTRSVATDASETAISTETDNSNQEAQLLNMMKTLVIEEGSHDSISDAVEALAYLSTKPETKEALSSDSAFLQRLFSLVPRKKTAVAFANTMESALVYGILVIVSNICAYRPRVTEEQSQVEKLKKMAQGGKQKIDMGESSPLMSDESVQIRVRRLVGAGVLGIVGSAQMVGGSLAVRLQLGKTLLSIVEDRENRGKVLQSGGAKVLSTLMKRALTPKNETLDPVFLETIQALAKLAITSHPLQAFGPDVGAIFDVIRPFSILLQHPSSTLLQKFEVTMALTNLSSYQPQIAQRIAQTDGLLSRVELLMLDDHTLLRRSAVELICNLIAGSDDVFNHYGGESRSGNSKSKLRILVALADVEDIPTVLAASGALATLTCSVHACRALAQLEKEYGRVLPVLTQLIEPQTITLPSEVHDVGDDKTTHENSGLVHRGVVCVRNLFKNADDIGLRISLNKGAQSVGLVKALSQLIKGEGLIRDQSILVHAAEAFKAVTEKVS